MKKDIKQIISNLEKMHGKERIELKFGTPPWNSSWRRCCQPSAPTRGVNRLTPALFKKYKQFQDYLRVPVEELEEDIRPTGFYRNKAKALRSIAAEVEDRFGGRIPEDVDTLATIKGIGRKSANLIAGIAFGKPAVIVDTHVIKVSTRVGLTTNKDPEKIEKDLKNLVPEKEWTKFSLLVTLPWSLYLPGA